MSGTHRASWLACALALVTACATPASAQTTRPAPGGADVPVRAVVLFSSGVGYFEHFGKVIGDGSTELRFKTDQVNDVLKSLLLQDLDGGTAGTVSYPSQEPLERTLKSFQVDVTANPSLSDLLNQLRGAKLKVTSGGQVIEGTILGVESRLQAEKESKPIEERHFLNLKAGRKVRVLPIEGVDDFEFEDPKLDEELDRALDALSQARDQTKKPVTINFRGRGERRVRLGYVVETPIWKTSYRLVVSEQRGGANKGGTLQGWAIVENQTDSDWNDVQLSLVSGRPISFIQDLYHPLYVPRPVVEPELYASLRPQTYEGGVTPEEMEQIKGKRAAAEEAGGGAPDFMLRSGRKKNGGGQGLFANAPGSGEADKEPIDPLASVRAQASGSKIGELFQYTVGNVSIARQKSAMIPIVNDEVEVEKLSVFNSEVLERHPLTGVRLKNTTKNHLLQGPVTVLEAGAYAGDARIENLPPGQERLVTYGVDLQTEVVTSKKDEPSVLETGKIVDGVLHAKRSYVIETQYIFENKGSADKAIVVEHERPEGGELVEPASAEEMTDALFRFRRSVTAGKAGKLTVRLRTRDEEQVQLLGAQVDAIAAYVSAREISPEVRKALDDVVQLKSALADATRQAEDRKKRLGELTVEQSRIRENMKTVSESSEYYTRLLKKLDEQETTIETLQKEAAAFTRQAAELREQLAAHVRDLNVG